MTAVASVPIKRDGGFHENVHELRSLAAVM